MVTKPTTIYINKFEQLQQMLSLLRSADTLFVDTEFHREATYWPQFALMQIAARSSGGELLCYLIDPVTTAPLEPLWELLSSPDQLKVFHAARQDVEIIHHLSGRLPTPLFDTQVAAALLGYGQQIGFGALVQQLTGVTLAKQATFTDWMKRPLSRGQQQYAADDVIHLMPVYAHLREQLQARGRDAWLDDEQQSLTDPDTYDMAVDTIFWRTKGCNRLKPKQLAVLRSLAAWREQAARRRDLPRRRLLGDESMVELARQEQLDHQRLAAIRGVSTGLVRRFGDEIVAAWREGVACPKADWPQRSKTPLHTTGSGSRAEMLTALLQLKADMLDIAPAILASRSDIAALASWGGLERGGELPDLRILKGWRRALIGDDLLNMLAGRIALSIDPTTKMPVIVPHKRADLIAKSPSIESVLNDE
ncbi:MAG: ribonuclease D [Mariprofundales bacterium]|nr:ribonuclease D [Mariprofundales bacterium]